MVRIRIPLALREVRRFWAAIAKTNAAVGQTLGSSILSSAGVDKMRRSFVPSFVSFTMLGLLLVAVCGCGMYRKTGDSSAGSSSRLSDESLKKSPKDSIAYQFELLKEGNVDKLKECFTERQRERITSEVVEKGKSQASNYTLDDLVASVEMGEYEGQSTAKIKMKNGRTLTTLIQTDGKWLADTVWFR